MNVFTVQSLESGYVHTYRSILHYYYYYYYYYYYVAICATNTINCVAKVVHNLFGCFQSLSEE